MKLRYKVKTTAYQDGKRLGSVHRIVGSLDSAELARQRNIEYIRRTFQQADVVITRKEVQS